MGLLLSISFNAVGTGEVDGTCSLEFTAGNWRQLLRERKGEVLSLSIVLSRKSQFLAGCVIAGAGKKR